MKSPLVLRFFTTFWTALSPGLALSELKVRPASVARRNKSSTTMRPLVSFPPRFEPLACARMSSVETVLHASQRRRMFPDSSDMTYSPTSMEIFESSRDTFASANFTSAWLLQALAVAMPTASSRSWERSPRKATRTRSRSASAVKGRLPPAEPSEAGGRIGKLKVLRSYYPLAQACKLLEQEVAHSPKWLLLPIPPTLEY
jgi:hypothetical protein